MPAGGSLETTSEADDIVHVTSVDDPCVAKIPGPSPTETSTSGGATGPAGEGQPGAGGTNSAPSAGVAVGPGGTGVGSAAAGDGEADTRGADEGTLALHPTAANRATTSAARLRGGEVVPAGMILPS
jgi:hypothetical protein